MEGHAAALEQVQQVRLGVLRHFPDRARLDGDIGRGGHPFEHRDRVAREFEDLAELTVGAVQFAAGGDERRDIARTPGLLRLAHVREDHVGDEAVRVRPALDQVVAAPQFERRACPVLGDQLTVVAARFEPVLRGDRDDARRVVRLAPGVEALDIRRADPHCALGGIPDHLEGRIAQHRAVQFGLEVELGEGVRRFDFAQRTFGGASTVAAGRGVAITRLYLDGVAVQQVAGDLIDERLGVVEGKPALALPWPAQPLAAFVEIEVFAVAAQAVFVAAVECGG